MKNFDKKIFEATLFGFILGIGLMLIIIAVLLAIFKNTELANYAVLLTIIYVTFPITLAWFNGTVSEQRKREREVISKNRQEWVNLFRIKMSEFISYSISLATQKNRTFTLEDELNLFQQITFIELLLSPKHQLEDSDYNTLLLIMEEYRALHSNPLRGKKYKNLLEHDEYLCKKLKINTILDKVIVLSSVNESQFIEEDIYNSIKDEYIDLFNNLLNEYSQKILKTEWERVKRGD